MKKVLFVATVTKHTKMNRIGSPRVHITIFRIAFSIIAYHLRIRYGINSLSKSDYIKWMYLWAVTRTARNIYCYNILYLILPY